MLGLVIFSAVLMLVDQVTDWLDVPRSAMTVAVVPVVMIADFPYKSAHELEGLFDSRDNMRRRVAELENELMLLKARTEKMAAVTVENDRLRNLLGSAAKLQDNVLVAELIGVSPDPEEQEVDIDKGGVDGVFVGQPVLDSQGLMGQVVKVSRFTSRVLLISDRSHSVPVQVMRSNLRLIAQGTGIDRQLELLHVNTTADIRMGDQLLSSGLGNRFPVGYPVGVVDKVSYESGESFVKVTARPNAQLGRTRHLLLVFTESRPAEKTQESEEKSDGSSG